MSSSSSFERFSIYSWIIRSFKVDCKPYWLRRKNNIFVENFLSMQSFWVSILSVTGGVENAVFVSSSVLPHDLYLLIMSYKWVLIKVTKVSTGENIYWWKCINLLIVMELWEGFHPFIILTFFRDYVDRIWWSSKVSHFSAVQCNYIFGLLKQKVEVRNRKDSCSIWCLAISE